MFTRLACTPLRSLTALTIRRLGTQAQARLCSTQASQTKEGRFGQVEEGASLEEEWAEKGEDAKGPGHEYTEDDWVCLGHLDRPLPFTPTDEQDLDVLRAETELYRLYRQIEDGELHWTEIVPLFTTIDQELCATAFMWTMYLKVIPTMFGVKREIARLLHYAHDFDVNTLNVFVQKLSTLGSNEDVYFFWEKCIIRSNQKRLAPNCMSLKIMLEQTCPIDNSDDEWWLDRGVLFCQSKREKGKWYRKTVDQWRSKPLTASHQMVVIEDCFKAIQRHKIEPDFTLLYLLARTCPVHIDYGRFLATRLAMYMESLPSRVVCTCPPPIPVVLSAHTAVIRGPVDAE